MQHMIFVNLPVQDLSAARDFYTALGFSLHEHFSDEHRAAVVVDDSIVVMLQDRELFAGLVAGEVGDPSRATTVVHTLLVDSREEVDDLVAKALGAGGKPWLPAGDEASRYSGSFTDPDGHVREVARLAQQHVIN